MARFSPKLVEHAQYPNNQGIMPNADRIGRASVNGNSPFITIYLTISGGVIQRAMFDAQGCGVTTAICSATTELVSGKSIEQCRLLTIDDISCELDGVPPDKRHCSLVCLKALANALEDIK
jgi:NifU-like protein involved in Fe-S cluster formation